jgi:uncharacterized protein YgiM (DUF1202 family)
MSDDWGGADFSRRMMELNEENNRRSWEESQRKKREEYQNSSAGSGTHAGSGSEIGYLVVLGIVGFILYKVYMFIKANWVSIVTILGICVVCLIVCFVIYKKARKTGLKTFFTILASVGLIITVLYSGPGKTEAFFANFQKIIPKLERKTLKEPASTEPISTSSYAYVISDALNIRSGPSVGNEIIGQLFKDQRVEIVDSSGQWWKIKFGDTEGYVGSDFLRQE